ncbi:signal recognition particle-docking protein FtsY [Aliiroseovarius sp. PrR006]|uniref:signal recognition particle-docking protein FtsY n=1 Tax=Aliiroseovarius sp. PrR006 TaxID=2706883 RepID=UPI0013D7C4F8|nr:signal recognition particle-docking protein FtsY [Aliiroseovarius sp. PrR006]NDW53059.1 signal recognition particle-docking protein FtsY [Aliiroseovarius sp. PrR006]
MAFFSKLKDRLFKSSSKLEEGLEAIVEDGGEEELVEATEAEAPEPAPVDVQAPVEEATPEPEPEPEPVAVAETPADASPEPEPEPEPIAQPVEALVESVPEEAAKPGLLGRMFGRREAQKVVRRTVDDDMLESLEDLMITSDMGVDTAMRVTANISESHYGKKLSVNEIKAVLANEVTRIMEPVAVPLPIYPKRPQVVLIVGVNGAGKTTTIGKLASQFTAAGKKVVIAAGDTFRAAAVEQLQVWGDRAGVPVLTAPEGSDPASLAFDAMTQAEADGADLLMIDTAGRLQNRSDLMEELAKIVRVIKKKDETAPHNTLLVLDATTGQNALSQVGTFQDLADVSGLVMTKLDGTAKGGVLVALADKFALPIHAIGVGEQIDDLAPFDPEEFARALIGITD